MTLQQHINSLSIRQLRHGLKSAGYQDGPITATTEHSYRKLLLKHFEDVDAQMVDYTLTDNCDTYVDGEEDEEDSLVYQLSDDSDSDSDGDMKAELMTEEQIPDNGVTGRGGINQGANHANYYDKVIPDTVREPPQFVPVRWNERQKRYESAYRGDSQGTWEDNNSWGKWFLLLSIAIGLVCALLASIYWANNEDPYKQLEDVVSYVASYHRE